MKRLFISTLTVLMSMGVLSTAASAAQVSPGSAIADLNGDGNVTLHEVVTYNREFRNKR